jgi:hypothetical protein
MARGTNHFQLLGRFLRRQYNVQSRGLCGCMSQLAKIQLWIRLCFWFKALNPQGLGRSGLPCMVEIYDQDNWVLFMLNSHRV